MINQSDLARTRRRAGIRQTQLAARAGVSQMTVSRVERGVGSARQTAAVREALALAVFERGGVVEDAAALLAGGAR